MPVRYIVKEDSGRVVIDQVTRDARDPRKLRTFDFLELTATVSNERITVKKGTKTILNSLLSTEIAGEDGVTFSNNVNTAADAVQKILNGQRRRSYEMTNYSTNSSFSGDVSYIDFPVAPYGDILDVLEKESVCFGDASDSVRGTSNTLELKNLSSGSEVKYEITVKYNVDTQSTFTLSSPTGHFATSSFSTTTLNAEASYIMTGTSSVTNISDWKLFGSITSSGSGTYRLSNVKITITR